MKQFDSDKFYNKLKEICHKRNKELKKVEKLNKNIEKIEKLNQNIEKIENKKNILAYNLYKAFVEKSQGIFSSSESYYFISLSHCNENKLHSIKLRYDDSLNVESIRKNYAIFVPENGASSRYRLEFNISEEFYETDTAIIDHDLFTELSAVWSSTRPNM